MIFIGILIYYIFPLVFSFFIYLVYFYDLPPNGTGYYGIIDVLTPVNGAIGPIGI